MAAQAPVLYLTATKDEDSTAVYLTSLERDWTTAETTPLTTGLAVSDLG
ncbi:hypothetical protein AB0C10_29500 [Microbispora amethystogenes]